MRGKTPTIRLFVTSPPLASKARPAKRPKVASKRRTRSVARSLAPPALFAAPSSARTQCRPTAAKGPCKKVIMQRYAGVTPEMFSNHKTAPAQLTHAQLTGNCRTLHSHIYSRALHLFLFHAAQAQLQWSSRCNPQPFHSSAGEDRAQPGAATASPGAA